MIRKGQMLKEYMLLCVIGVLTFAVYGCMGAVKHKADFDPAFLPNSGTRVEVGTVTNDTGDVYDIDITTMFMNALNKTLDEKKLLWTGESGGNHIIITSKVIEYDKGSAFKRWLAPGWGSTVLSVHCEITESSSKKNIGSIDTRRTVSIGGGFSVDAWKTIFADVAQDVVKELRSKIPSK